MVAASKDRMVEISIVDSGAVSGSAEYGALAVGALWWLFHRVDRDLKAKFKGGISEGFGRILNFVLLLVAGASGGYYFSLVTGEVALYILAGVVFVITTWIVVASDRQRA